MNGRVFADTFHWLAAINPSDAYHRAAISRPSQAKLTSVAVLIEVMDALSAPRYRPIASHFWGAIHRDPLVRIMPMTSALLDEAASYFDRFSDKGWSMTDCVSCILMRAEGISEALTKDQHFRQMGFKTAY